MAYSCYRLSSLPYSNHGSAVTGDEARVTMQKNTLLLLCKGVLLLHRCLAAAPGPLRITVEDIYTAVTHSNHPLHGTFGDAALTPAMISGIMTAGCMLKKTHQARNMLLCAIE